MNITTNCLLAVTNQHADWKAVPAVLRIQASGRRQLAFDEREVYRQDQGRIKRTFDPVGFPTYSDWAFPVTAQAGWFRWTRRYLDEKKTPFPCCSRVGCFPMLKDVLRTDRHFAGKLRLAQAGEAYIETDGDLESAVLPYTISGEWLAAIPVTMGFLGFSALTLGVYPAVSAYMLATDDGAENEMIDNMRTSWKGPLALVGSPVADAFALAMDLGRMTGAAMLDAGALAGRAVADLACSSGGLCIDLLVKSAKLIADSAIAVADLFHWERQETEVASLPDAYGDWRRGGIGQSVADFGNFAAQTTVNGEPLPLVPLNQEGEAVIVLTEIYRLYREKLRANRSRSPDQTRELICVTNAIVRRSNVLRLSEPVAIVFERDDFVNGLFSPGKGKRD